MKTTGAICRKFNGNAKTCAIILSYKAYKKFGFETIAGYLRHELAHWAQHMICGYSDHGLEWKLMCEEVGGTMCRVMAGERFKHLGTDRFIDSNKKYVYTCPVCKQKIFRMRKLREKILNRTCGICHTRINKWEVKKIA